MEVKGSIGEEVYVKAKITEIRIDANGIEYYAVPLAKNDNSIVHRFDAKNIKFPEDDKNVKAPMIKAKAEEVIKKASEGKRRGRPPKGEKAATLESLAHKAKVARSQIEE